MQHLLPRIALCGGVALASGCQIIPETRTAIHGARYEELVRLAEAEVPDMAKAGTAKLVRLCLAYSKTKRYDKIFACADRLEANIRRGDRHADDYNEELEWVKGVPILGPLAIMLGPKTEAQAIAARERQGTRQDVGAMPHLIRAEAMIDLGQYAEAAREAQTATRAISWKGSSRQLNVLAWLRALTTAAVAAALNGEPQRAREILARLNQFDLEKGPDAVEALRRERSEGLAKAHIALRDYAQALAVLDYKKDDSQAALGRLLILPADLLLFGGQLTRGISNMQTGASLPGRFLLAKCQFEV